MPSDDLKKPVASYGRTLGRPEIVYEDNHVIVAIKPPGFLSQADGGPSPDMLTWLKAYVKDTYQKPGDVYLGLVHRLDQPVGGLMVFARTSKAAARLSSQIRDHEMEKGYLAVVHGLPEPSAGEIRICLKKAPATNLVRVDPTGLESTLTYETVRHDEKTDSTLLRIRLGTGRGHQIRVSLAHAGWPIVFDQRYGSSADRGRGDIALFAHRLGFRHPTLRDLRLFEAPIPTQAPFDRFQPLGV